MMTCKDINALVTDFLEHSMTLWDRIRFRIHMVMCTNCRNHVHKMEHMVDAMGSIPDDTQVPEEMLKRFESWTR